MTAYTDADWAGSLDDSLLLGTVSLWEQIGSRGKARSSQLYPDQVQK